MTRILMALSLITALVFAGVAWAERSISPYRLTQEQDADGEFILVYLHGVYHGGWAFSELHPLLKPLVSAQYLLDLRGHYGDQRIHADDNIGFSDYLKDVTDALDLISGNKVLVGHSLGGLLSMSVLSRSDVQGAVLLTTPLPEVIKKERWSLLFHYPINSLAMIARRDASHLYHDKKWVKEYFFSQSTPHEIFDPAFQKIQEQNEPFQLFDDINDLKIDVSLVRKPVLVIAGSEDPTVDEEGAWILANRFGVKPIFIKDAGHDLMLEKKHANEIAQIIQTWLYEHIK